MKKISLILHSFLIFFFLAFQVVAQDLNADFLAAVERGDPVQVKALLGKGAEVNPTDHQDRTALMVAAWRGHLNIVKVLLDHGGAVNIKDDDGWTPLMYAVKGGNPDIVKILIDKGGAVNAADDTGCTVLMRAAIGGNRDMVQALLDKGAEVNAADHRGRTALIWAAMLRKLDIAGALLDKGANVNAKDAQQWTAWGYAQDKGDARMVALLKSRGAIEEALPPLEKPSPKAAPPFPPPPPPAPRPGAAPPPTAAAPTPPRAPVAPPGAAPPPTTAPTPTRPPVAPGAAPPKVAKAKPMPLPKAPPPEAGEPAPENILYSEKMSGSEYPPAAAAKAGPPRTTQAEIPQFPWPPPKSSAFAKIRRELLVKRTGPTRVGDVSDRLEKAFEQAGYGERTWYAVPEGFALASRLEQFNPDGTPKEENERWSAQVKMPAIFGLRDVIRALFTAQEGHYRIIVFMVTPHPFSESEKKVTPEEAGLWVRKGAHELPETIRKLEYTHKHYCSALIYEFEQVTRNQEPAFKDPSQLQGETHLKKARLWAALEDGK